MKVISKSIIFFLALLYGNGVLAECGDRMCRVSLFSNIKLNCCEVEPIPQWEYFIVYGGSMVILLGIGWVILKYYKRK